jgi:hypothetical protein
MYDYALGEYFLLNTLHQEGPSVLQPCPFQPCPFQSWLHAAMVWRIEPAVAHPDLSVRAARRISLEDLAGPVIWIGGKAVQ